MFAQHRKLISIEKNMATNQNYQFSEVYPQENNKGALFLGDYNGARNLDKIKQLNIKAVFTVAQELKIQYPENMQIMHHTYKLNDVPNQVIRQHFDQVSDQIDKYRQMNINVFIHCHMGISRGASFVIAYLIKFQNMSFLNAMMFLSQRRKIIYPNPGFVVQLKQYEQKIHQNIKPNFDLNQIIKIPKKSHQKKNQGFQSYQNIQLR